MRNRIYRIRNKETKEFINLGCNQKHTWLVYPHQAIRNNQHILHDMNDYEVVVYEYKEIETLSLIKYKNER
jgi:hypothetical protein